MGRWTADELDTVGGTDELRVAQPLAPDRKQWLLESAVAFRAVVQAARDWEKGASSASASAQGASPPLPQPTQSR